MEGLLHHTKPIALRPACVRVMLRGEYENKEIPGQNAGVFSEWF